MTTRSVPADQVPIVLRSIADQLENDSRASLIGLWNTGFGEPWEACLQVVIAIDTHDDPVLREPGEPT